MLGFIWFFCYVTLQAGKHEWSFSEKVGEEKWLIDCMLCYAKV